MRHFWQACLSLAIIVIATTTWAADYPISWVGHESATQYRIALSTDQGTSWVEIAPVLQPAPFPSDGKISTIVTVADSQPLTLIRIAAENGNGVTVRPDAGLWISPTWKPPPQPASLGVQ